MKTYQEHYENAQTITGDSSAATLASLKADISLGAKKITAMMGSYYTRKSKSTNIVAEQQYYQTPPDCLKITGVDTMISASQRYPLTQVRSEYKWRQMNMFTTQTSGYSTHYFNKGADEIGLYPMPSSDLTNGLIIYYEPKSRELTQADYKTGTIALTNGSNVVTGTGTAFTPSMVGRILKTTDGSDGYYYKISGYSSGTSLTIEEPYIGNTGTGITYKIGESYLIPEEYEDGPTDFALSRYFEQRNNIERAAYHLKRFKMTCADVKEEYASSSTSSLITGDTSAIVSYWQLPPTTVVTE